VASLLGPIFTALAPLSLELGSLASLFGSSFVSQATAAMDSGCFCSSTTDWGALYDSMQASTLALLQGGDISQLLGMMDTFFNTITTCPAAASAVPTEVAFTAKMSGTVETFPLESVCAKFAASVEVAVADVTCSVTAGSVIFEAKVTVSGLLAEGKVTSAVAAMSTPAAVEEALELEELGVTVAEVLPPTSTTYYASPSPPPEDSGLSTGVIIGIAAGAGVAVAVIVGILAYCMCCKKKGGGDAYPKAQA